MELAPALKGVNKVRTAPYGWVLLLGFGGLLLLMAFGGFDAIRALTQIREGSDQIHAEFLRRDRTLEKIRADLYVSGTYVRDYLLDPEPTSAELHRKNLERLRVDMARTLLDYAGYLRGTDQHPFLSLRRDLNSYWRVLDPIFKWSASDRRDKGYVFLRDEVFPRRTTMLHIADQIAEMNQQDLRLGDRGILELFSGFRRRAILTLTSTLLLGGLLAALAIRSVLRSQREAAERFDEVYDARLELKNLSARLVNAQEEERKGIARELHDEVGQALSALVLGIGNLTSEARSRGLGFFDADLESLRSVAEGAVRVVRNMSLLLRPSMLDDLGLIPALQWQAREIHKRWGLTVRVATGEINDDLADEQKTCVYRVVQEALNNVAKHARAETAKVVVRQEDSRIVLTIQDDGLGFDVKEGKGLGLLGIQERVAQLGGDLELMSEKGRGTLISVTLPMHPLRAIMAKNYE